MSSFGKKLFGKQKDTGVRYSTPDVWEGSRAYYESIANGPGPSAGGEGEGVSYGEYVNAKEMLKILDSAGVNHITQVPGFERVGHEQSNSLFQQINDFATHPAVLTAAGGVAGVYAGGAASAAGAGSGSGSAAGAGTVGGLTAAEEAAMLGAASTSGGGGAAAAGGAATTTGTTAGGMQPGVGEYGELGSAGWEGGTPGGPGVTSGATAGGSTALSRILDGTATDADYLTLTGQVAPSLLGMYASGKQTDALKAQTARYEAMGAPYRSKLAALYENPNAFLTSPEVTVPVQQGTDIMARSLSTKGNPTGSGNALQELQSYSANQLFGKLGQEKDRLAGFGGLSYYNQAAPQAATNAISSQANFYNAAGAGIADVFGSRRQRSLTDLLREGGY